MNFASNVWLLFVSQGAGFALLVSVVFLLYKRRIYLNAVTKMPIEVEMPILGKLKSQSPVIVIIFIGAALVLYPIYMARTELGTVEGSIHTSGKSVTVTVVAQPRFQETLHTSG